jgi:hypothetical protein
MVVTVVGWAGGASGCGFAEHGGGGCPLTYRASAGLPAPPLQAASTRTADTGSTGISRLQVRQVRTGGPVPAAADAPRRDDKLIATLPWTGVNWDHAAAGRGGDVPWILMPSGEDPGLGWERAPVPGAPPCANPDR